jgi:hypothetical protein
VRRTPGLESGGGRVALAAGFVVAALLLVGSRAAAIDFEKLLMPGPVIAGHADIEGDCGRCHAAFEKEAQDPLCLECHSEVGKDLAGKVGFHGRAPGVARARCRDCHGEHEGRDADVVGLDRAAFDHGLSDYPLHGAHARVPCESCHRPDAKFREAPGTCIGCHRDDDAHAGKLGEDCGSCHREAAWRQVRFDHDRTKFPLTGGHRDAPCALCHANGRYEGTTTDCNDCHRVDDVHVGRFGPECEQCHRPDGWKTLHFDHARDTKFALRAAHAPLACAACHTQGPHAGGLATDCASCHRADDVHRGRRGDGCERCHGEVSWKTEGFDHDEVERFPLRGAHRQVSCDACHTGTLGREQLATRCGSCHEDDDVHRGQLGDACDGCHVEKGWAEQVFFEHDVTRFPLLGLHATVACEQCHTTLRFHDVALECNGCHARDDLHVGRLGPDCARCHNPNGWDRWRFDHDRDTRFELRGAHEPLDCHACHRAPPDSGVPLLSTCAGCHARDDRHGGGFGSDCERCHGETSWSEVEIRR